LIFVTVGSQGPFDRLIHAVDEWTALRGRSDVFAQIGKTKHIPKYIRFTESVDPVEFKHLVGEARLIVAHAGMGSIISAFDSAKPIVVMPRRAQFREQRNDHQMATARHFESTGQVIVAYEEQSLAEKLDYALTLGSVARVKVEGSPELIATIRSFLDCNCAPHEFRLRRGQN
jgi:UDP-N-acetylglucosamine transferase subunit ALG13